MITEARETTPARGPPPSIRRLGENALPVVSPLQIGGDLTDFLETSPFFLMLQWEVSPSLQPMSYCLRQINRDMQRKDDIWDGPRPLYFISLLNL
ncbi:hypothetical protein YC2023_115572 [Brassica napus]